MYDISEKIFLSLKPSISFLNIFPRYQLFSLLSPKRLPFDFRELSEYSPRRRKSEFVCACTRQTQFRYFVSCQHPTIDGPVTSADIPNKDIAFLGRDTCGFVSLSANIPWFPPSAFDPRQFSAPAASSSTGVPSRGSMVFLRNSLVSTSEALGDLWVPGADRHSPRVIEWKKSITGICILRMRVCASVIDDLVRWRRDANGDAPRRR